MKKINIYLKSHKKKLNDISNNKFFFKGNIFYKNNLISSDQLHYKLSRNLNENYIIEVSKNLNGFYSWIFLNEEFIILSVDHIRSLPLFYLTKNSHIFISDDANWIREENNLTGFDHSSSEEFKLSGLVSDNQTLFKEIKQLCPGQILIFNRLNQGLNLTREFFNFDYENNSNLNKNQTLNELEEKSNKSFKRLVSLANNKDCNPIKRWI